MNSLAFIAQEVPVCALPLSQLHETYQQQHPAQNKQDKNHTAKAFSIIAETTPGLDSEQFGKAEFRKFKAALIPLYCRSQCNKLMRKAKAVFRRGAANDLCSEQSYRDLCLVESVKYGEARETEPRDAVSLTGAVCGVPSRLLDSICKKRRTCAASK